MSTRTPNYIPITVLKKKHADGRQTDVQYAFIREILKRLHKNQPSGEHAYIKRSMNLNKEHLNDSQVP
jgi:hypothetical protein